MPTQKNRIWPNFKPPKNRASIPVKILTCALPPWGFSVQMPASGVNDKSHFSKLRQVIFLSASFRGPATTLRLGIIDRVNLSRENNTLHMTLSPCPRAKFRTLSQTQSEIAKKNCGTYSVSFYFTLK